MHFADDAFSLSPSDLTAYLGCRHLTTLALRVARGELAKPAHSEGAELVFRKGLEHERAYFEQLVAEGRSVREITFGEGGLEEAAVATRQALAHGVDVVFQGVLIDGNWRGVADFLERQPDGTYEAVDTKLARSGKPSHILQLCFYSEVLGRIQGREPEHMHVLLGSGERVKFRPREFAAYARRLRGALERFVADPPHTEPTPVDHCSICEFIDHCTAWWTEVDHLSLVAGLGRVQADRLRAAGVTTVAQLAATVVTPAGVNADTYAKLHRQARLQLARRNTGTAVFELLQPEAERGLALLPDPSPGDLFFDIEGNPFWNEEGSLEYLWGISDAHGAFTAFWAHDRDTERRAFEQVVDLIHARLRDDPNTHVYHYASYEVSALRRLMGRYGSRENEVDDLLRRGVLVDLFKVVRGGVAASVPSYSLKEMEIFLDFPRNAEIKDGGTSIIEYERWMQTGHQALLDAIAAYNEEDCNATLALRDWLLERRSEALARFGAFPLPEPEESKPVPEIAIERAQLRDELLEGGHDLAPHLLDYHRREAKPVWWAFFDRVEKTVEELRDEDRESIGGLEPVGEPEPDKKSFVHTLTWPAQEHKIGEGQEVIDPQTREGAGKITELDRDERWLRLRRGPSLEDVPLPEALIPGGPYWTSDQEAALMRFGRSVLAGDRRYPALESILARRAFDRDVQTTDLDEMKALVRSLDGRHLFIQGPPGSGKTWTSGRLIADLVARGKTVGVASTSHKAIHKLLDEVVDAGIDVRGVKKASEGNPESFYERGTVVSNTKPELAPLTGGTAWLYAREELDSQLDYLFIDEAGQVSLADAIAMGTCARNVVLVGDPQQLAQVIQGTHPNGAGVSVLQHLLGEDDTVPRNRGLFLEQTWRLHPDVCGYISEEFYDGRLSPAPVAAERTTPLGTGLRWLAVDHEGCRQESRAEAEAVRDEIARLAAVGVALGDVKVVAPYNAQVNLLRELLPDAVEVGTVDKFQGQEALVVFYSMASSSGEDVPRSMEFLFSRNRLNVAIARAQALAYLVCSPRLLEVNARTIDQMRLANALCRFVELTETSHATRLALP